MQRHHRGGAVPAASLPRIRAAGLLLLCAYLGLVAWLTLRPVSVPWVAPANLTPLATVREQLADGSPHALAGLGGELALLAPLGVLLPLAAGRLHRSLPGTCARTVSGGAVTSAVIVLVQSAVPGHRVNVDSVVLNTAGVALVALLLFPLLRAWLLRRAAYGARAGAGGRSGHVGGGPGGAGGAGRSGGRAGGAGGAYMRRVSGLGGGVVTVGDRGGALRRPDGPDEGPTPRAARVGIAP